MKSLMALVLSLVAAGYVTAEEYRPPTKKTDGQKRETNSPVERLILKHDTNTNGVIDISERPAYLKERNAKRRAERLEAAQARARAPKIDGKPAAWDSNRDGRVSLEEAQQATARGKTAQTNRLSSPKPQP